MPIDKDETSSLSSIENGNFDSDGYQKVLKKHETDILNAISKNYKILQKYPQGHIFALITVIWPSPLLLNTFSMSFLERREEELQMCTAIEMIKKEGLDMAILL